MGLALSYSPLIPAQSTLHYDASLGADYRQAHMDWNIAGSLAGTSPNVLSELSWNDLEIAQISGSAQVTVSDRIVVRASGAYGSIISGKNQDSDYLGDNRTFQFSQSDNDGSGHITDASVGLGYRVRLYDETVGHYAYVTPMAGYSQHRQNLKITNGVQTVPALGPIPGLDSSYDAEWKGPWAGLNLWLEVTDRTALNIDFAYHWADYSAEANWNLRDDWAHPVSYRHDSNGTGVVTGLSLTHNLGKNWDITARLESQHWVADAGLDTTYTVDSSTGAIQPVTTRLNVVHWKSRAAGIAATYRF